MEILFPDRPSLDLVLTAAAHAALVELLADHDLPLSAGLRISSDPQRPAGRAWIFELGVPPREGDLVLEHDGLRLAFDAGSRALLEGHELDHVDHLLERGFLFRPRGPEPPRAGCASGPAAPLEV